MKITGYISNNPFTSIDTSTSVRKPARQPRTILRPKEGLIETPCIARQQNGFKADKHCGQITDVYCTFWSRPFSILTHHPHSGAEPTFAQHVKSPASKPSFPDYHQNIFSNTLVYDAFIHVATAPLQLIKTCDVWGRQLPRHGGGAADFSCCELFFFVAGTLTAAPGIFLLQITFLFGGMFFSCWMDFSAAGKCFSWSEMISFLGAGKRFFSFKSLFFFGQKLPVSLALPAGTFPRRKGHGTASQKRKAKGRKQAIIFFSCAMQYQLVVPA